MHATTTNARPPRERRAFSLLELTAVVAIIGLMAGVAVMRWGDYALTVTTTQGFVRSLKLSLDLARRQAIGEGDPAAVVLNRTSGAVTSLQIVRVDGGDIPTDAEIEVPSGATVTTTVDRWEFDYTGTLVTPAAGGFIGVGDGDWNYDLTVNPVTGHVEIVKAK